MADAHPYGSDFSDRPGDAGARQNLLHAIRGGVTSGNEYRVLNMPRCQVYSVGTQSPTSGVATLHTFDTIEYDTDSMWGVGASTTRITANTPGLYLFDASVTFAPNATGYRQIYFLKNGTTLYGGLVVQPAAGNGSFLCTSWPISLNKREYVENVIVQTSGGVLATDASSATNRYSAFAATLISTIG